LIASKAAHVPKIQLGYRGNARADDLLMMCFPPILQLRTAQEIEAGAGDYLTAW
jgi:hypothetical protein